MPTAQLDPDAVTALLRRRWQAGHRRWLDGEGSWPLPILLHPPTEREAARDPAGLRSWIEGWVAADADPERPGELTWTERQWPGLGRQRLPERLTLTAPEQVALWLGQQERWATASGRAAAIRALLRPAAAPSPTTAAPGGGDEAPTVEPKLARLFDWLASVPDVELQRLLAVLRWLLAHPDSGLYVRQLPIPGIDTKWIGANRGRLVDLLSQRVPAPASASAPDPARGEGDLHRLAGLRRAPDLVRLRLLDPRLRARVGGLGDLSAPVEQIGAASLAPKRVFVVENLATGLAFADLPDCLCFMARGYAVEAFGAIPWLQGVPIHYWGDLDTHGFAILNRLRGYLPDAGSLLMDADTLLRHRDLWQREDKPASGPLERLTPDEQAVFEGLQSGRWGEQVRLEQERIDWGYAWARVRVAAGVTATDDSHWPPIEQPASVARLVSGEPTID